MKPYWHIYTLLFILLVQSFSASIAFSQPEQDFPPLEIARADNILENAEGRIMQLASDINLYLTKDISIRKFNDYNHFEPIEQGHTISIKPEEKNFSPRNVEDYLKLLKNQYESVKIVRYAFIEEVGNPCEKIFYYKANPDLGIFYMQVVRIINLQRYARKNEPKIIEQIRDTVLFTFKIDLTDFANQDPKIVNISKFRNDKTIEITKPVLCIEDEEERIWNQIQKRRTPQGYLDYLNRYPKGRYRLEAANERYFLSQRIRDLEVIKSDKELFTYSNLTAYLEEYEARLEGSVIEEDIVKLLNTLSDDNKDYLRITNSNPHKKEKARKKWELNQLQKHIEAFEDVCQHLEELKSNSLNNDSTTYDSIFIEKRQPFWAIELRGGGSSEVFYDNPLTKKGSSFSSFMNTVSPHGELGVAHISRKGLIFQFSVGIKRAIYDCSNITWQYDRFRDSCVSFANHAYVKPKIWIWNTNLSLGYDFVPRKNLIFGFSSSLRLQGGEFPEINSVNSSDLSSSHRTPIVTKNTFWGGGSLNIHLGTVPQKNGWGFEFTPRYNYWVEFHGNRKHHYPQIDLGLILVLGN